jgi:hypothetical protein
MIPPVRRGLVRAAIVTIVALVSLGAARTSVMTTSSFITPAGARAWSVSYDQVLCLQSTLHRSVPKGARVYLEPSNVQAGNLILALITVLWAHPSSAGQAKWMVSLSPGPGGCTGLRFQAVKRE